MAPPFEAEEQGVLQISGLLPARIQVKDLSPKLPGLASTSDGRQDTRTCWLDGPNTLQRQDGPPFLARRLWSHHPWYKMWQVEVRPRERERETRRQQHSEFILGFASVQYALGIPFDVSVNRIPCKESLMLMARQYTCTPLLACLSHSTPCQLAVLRRTAGDPDRLTKKCPCIIAASAQHQPTQPRGGAFLCTAKGKSTWEIMKKLFPRCNYFWSQIYFCTVFLWFGFPSSKLLQTIA